MWEDGYQITPKHKLSDCHSVHDLFPECSLMGQRQLILVTNNKVMFSQTANEISGENYLHGLSKCPLIHIPAYFSQNLVVTYYSNVPQSLNPIPGFAEPKGADTSTSIKPLQVQISNSHTCLVGISSPNPPKVVFQIVWYYWCHTYVSALSVLSPHSDVAAFS